ncbi:MAG TPA: polysaccharide biosynthesis tyrosine autokinase [Candidatus Lumbricidophila sp.]|nr:polysaccharide biosynthesis tyrosine autokinase [Candidatus Lumbricidophila sp.]
MEARDILTAMSRRWMVLAAVALVGLGAAIAVDSTQPTLYKATTSVYVSTMRGNTGSELVQGNTFAQTNVASYAQLAETPKVLQPVIDRLGLTESVAKLQGAISIDNLRETVIIAISAADSDPARAVKIADAVADSLAIAVEELAPKDAEGQPAVELKTVAPAETPKAPFAPNTKLTVATGLVAGLLVGLLLVLALEFFDTRVRGASDLTRVTDAPLLGTISRRRDKNTSLLALRADPHSPRAEAYRRLRANLEFADVDHHIRSFVVTSSVAAEGKSTTAINLALALGEVSDNRVLLIDCDLRRPSIARTVGIEGAVGVTTVLIGGVSVEDAIQHWGGAVDILPSGAIPPNPGQLLGSAAMASLMRDLLQTYSHVVVDSPPLLPTTDALGLAHLTDGVIMVAKYKSTRREQIARALESLVLVRARVIGVILDRVPTPKRHVSYYDYRSEATKPVHSSDANSAATKLRRVLRAEPKP